MDWFKSERAKWAAGQGANAVTLVPNPAVKAIADGFRAGWQATGKPAAAMPLMGLTRHVVVADSDAKAQEIARAAYGPWRKSMAFLWEWYGVEFLIASIYPGDFDALQKAGMGIAGSPQTVRRWVADLVAETGITYLLCDPVFGSMPFVALSALP